MSAHHAQAIRRHTTVGLWTALALAVFNPVSRADDAGILNGAFLETTDGKQVYEAICQGCHMSTAQGADGAGHYPALAKIPRWPPANTWPSRC